MNKRKSCKAKDKNIVQCQKTWYPRAKLYQHRVEQWAPKTLEKRAHPNSNMIKVVLHLKQTLSKICYSFEVAPPTSAYTYSDTLIITICKKILQ